jgi:O-antigen/teichoic acid export membrane protein/GT2 family glycosyltransferase
MTGVPTTAGPNPLVAVLVLNWNQWRYTMECIRALSTTGYPNWHALVLDNGSTNDSFAELRDRLPAAGGPLEARGVSLLRSEVNLGFSGGCNLLIEHALARGADYLLLLNNDAFVSNETLEALTATAQATQAGVVGAIVTDLQGKGALYRRRWPADLFGLDPPPAPAGPADHWESDRVEGTAMLVSRALVEESLRERGFVLDPSFFMYWEDADLCLFARSRGYGCVIAGRALVRHSAATSSGGQANPRGYYYQTRNRVAMARRWLGPGLRALFHMYFWPSRILLASWQTAHGSLPAATAILGGLMDAVLGRTGPWRYHSTGVPLRWGADLARVVSHAREGGFFGFMVALAVVQGAPALGQLVAARLLGPEEFGVVRLAEATLALLLIPAGLGMSSAVVRYTAVAAAETARRRVLGSSLGVGLVGGIIVVVATVLLAPYSPLSQPSSSYLRGLVVMILFTNASRTVLNYFQGAKEFGRAAGWSIVTAALSLGAVVAGTALLGLQGWAFARVGGEAICAFALLWFVRDALLHTAQPPPGLLRFGVLMAASLGLDRVATTADILILDARLKNPALVGQYGAASLVISAGSLLPAAVVAFLLPRLAERSPRPAEAIALATTLLRPFGLLLLLLGALLAAFGPFALTLALGQEYALAGRLLLVLAPAFVLTALLSYAGSVLLALDRADLALVQSAVGAATSLALNVRLVPSFGVWGAAAATLGTHVVRLVVMMFMVRRAIDRSKLGP